MGVYTELKEVELKHIENLYNIQVEKIEYIDRGILNSNFILYTYNNIKYILRIFEADRSVEEEEQELKLLEDISDLIPVTPAIKNNKDEFISEYNNKKMALFTYIDGIVLEAKNVNQAILRELAWNLGKLHRYSEEKKFQDINFSRKSRINLDFYLKKLEEENLNFEEKEKILNLAGELKNIDFSNLPSGIIHSDIFPDNIILKDGHIATILDFNEAQFSAFIFDIAIVINFWIKINNFDFQKENEMIRDFLNNYSRYRKIKKEELSLLNWACKKMALTFILLRMYKEKTEANSSFSTAIEIENKSYLSLLDLI